MPSLKRQSVIEFALFVVLVTLGVSLRISLEELPNFAPVAALALFAGYFFRSRLVAIALPISIMLISDAFIGRYAWWQMAIVYTMLALPVTLRGVLRRHFSLTRGTKKEFAQSLAGLLGCSLGASVLFFIVTNAICLGWYEPTLAGVVKCYAQALPFFRYTLAGDIAFALLTFGSYATVMSAVSALEPKKTLSTCDEPALARAA